MALQKCQKKNIAKKFEFKFEFYLGFPEIVFLALVLPLEKCPRCRINSSEFINIYMYFIKVLYISLYFIFSLP